MLTETIRHFIEIYELIGWTCLYTDSLCTVNIILILMHLPVFYYQNYQQCGSLCKKPKKPPTLVHADEYLTVRNSFKENDGNMYDDILNSNLAT